MIKHLTALILVLAIANPFCCCFGMDPVQGKAQPAPCWQTPTDESGDSSPDDDSLLKGCPCKKPVVAEYKELDSHGSKVLKSLVLIHDYQDQAVTFVSTPDIRLGFFMRPPPPRLRLHIVHCVYRT